MKRIGVFGGSFDPVHTGHLILAERAVEALRLDRLLFVPTAVTPHKRTRKLAPAKHRLAMVRAAVRGHPVFEASDIEIRRGGVSYTVETLRELKRRSPGARLHLLLGADSLGILGSWKDIREIARTAALCVFERPDCGKVSVTIKGIRVRRIDAPLVEISSTDIRRRVRRGRSIRFLVPESVRTCIATRRLYRR
ncbi:MAG: nicotinate-nucleotide adenylyltransferase [Planctomycetota bacterium]|jgi:nicotinate-nucleotide adenylyltransferase